MWLMFNYPKSSVRVLRMLMHLSSGHVTLPLGEFPPHEIFPKLDLRRWSLPQISSYLCIRKSRIILCLEVLIFFINFLIY